jgi:Ca2+-transporting ATPase
MRTLREITDQFPEARDRGLSAAEVAHSLSRFGANRLTPLPREPVWQKFLAKFDEPIIKILLAATLLKTVVDLFASPGPWGVIGLALVAAAFVVSSAFKLRDWLPSILFGVAVVLVVVSLFTPHPSFEGLAVMVAVVLATGVAFLSEYKSDREFEVLNAQKESLRAKVMRDREVRTVPLENVVVGDLVVLEMGDEVPADGRVVRATELLIDQSLLTGESEPVRKTAGRANDAGDGPEQPGCVYRGTQVVDGAGGMVVTEVGDLTMIGQIARRLSADEPEATDAVAAEDEEAARVKRKLTLSKEQTPLQVKLTALARLISRVGYAAAVAIFVALLVRGAFTNEVRFGPTFVVDPATGDYALAEDVINSTNQNLNLLIVHQQDIQAVVNAMWKGGASAVTIQGQRVVSTTGIKCEGNSVQLQGVPYPQPYEITAVGNQSAILEAINTDDYLEIYRADAENPDILVGWDLEVEDNVTAPAFEGLLDISYAEPIR